MNYRIIYHKGDSISTKTKVDSGYAALSDGALVISGSKPMTIPYADLKSVDLFRLHGLGRTIRIAYSTDTLFVSVVRINIFGYFAIINFLKTGKFCDLLQTKIASA